MPIYEITNWKGAISSSADRGARGSAKMTTNLDVRKTVDTLTCGQALKDEGVFGGTHSSSASKSQSPSLSPSASASKSASDSGSSSASQSPSSSASPSGSKSLSPSPSQSPSASASPSPSPSGTIFDVFEDLILFFVKATDGNTYGFGDGGHIYRRFPDGYTRMAYTDTDGSIRGAIEKPSSTGKTYLQWATSTSIKRKELPGESDWSDVEEIADNLSGVDWHTMKQVGGANMIANGSYLAMVGYDDSYTNDALDIIPGDVIKALVERNGRVVMGTYKAGYPNKGTNAMIDAEYPLSQVGDDGELFYADFVNTMPVKRFPGGGRVNPGGVANEEDQVNLFDWDGSASAWIDKQALGNMSLWGVFGADSGKNGIYTYGRKNKEQLFTMNLEYALEVDEIGAVVNVEGTTIASYRNGSTYGVKAVDSATKAIGTYESLEFRAPIKSAEVITNWKHAEILMEALPSGTSVEFHFKADKASSWTQANTASGDSSFSTADGKKAVFAIGVEGDIFEQKIVLNPTGNVSPTVLRSRLYFE